MISNESIEKGNHHAGFFIYHAVFFIEYRYVITPGIARYDSLTAEKQKVEGPGKYHSVKPGNRQTEREERDENLDHDQDISKTLFWRMQMDALLVRPMISFSRKALARSIPIQQILASSLAPQTASEFDMTYQLKSLANTYQILTGKEQVKPADPAAPPAVAGDQVEQYQIGINARGSYNQIKSFLDAINNMQRSVVISTLVMVPDLTPPEPTPEPTEPGDEPAPTPTPTEPIEPVEPPNNPYGQHHAVLLRLNQTCSDDRHIQSLVSRTVCSG